MSPSVAPPGMSQTILTEAAAAEAAAAAAIAAKQHDAFTLKMTPPPTADKRLAFPELRGAEATPSTPADVRLHHRAAVVAAGDESSGLVGLVRQLSIDQFENENRRISFGVGEIGAPGSASRRGNLTPVRTPSGDGVHKKVLELLLRPREWRAPQDRSFILDIDGIEELCGRCEEILKLDPTVLQLSAPVKIFGDLHGQFGDLMRLFAEYGSPSTAGDMPYIDYLFLGDYVDRGAHSLETICLLLALKIEHPKNVHLLRGNHEAADINSLFGFRMECVERLGEEGGLTAWERFNSLFNWMSLAAVIEKRVICMHGGIGRSIEKVEQLEALQRPLTMESGGLVLMDLLWSDPTENDGITGLQPNARGPGLVTFGPDRVRDFCEQNNLQVIIRAHECVMDGFERFAQGQLITLFSATNYCGTANNAGAILILGRDLTLYPKLIHPLPPSAALDDEFGGAAPPLSVCRRPRC